MPTAIYAIVPSQTWPLRHTVMWPDKPLDYVKLPEDAHGIHYGLFVNDHLVSVISLFIKGEDAQFRKFATALSHQGKGYGSQLLKYLMQEAASKGIKKLWCNARKDKASFYENFGMIKTSHSFIKGGIGYVVMELVRTKT